MDPSRFLNAIPLLQHVRVGKPQNADLRQENKACVNQVNLTIARFSMEVTLLWSLNLTFMSRPWVRGSKFEPNSRSTRNLSVLGHKISLFTFFFDALDELR